MKRTVLLPALLALSLVFAGAVAVAGCSSDSEAAQALQRSLEKTRDLGARMSMTGTFGAGGESVRMTSRMSVEPGARRMRMTSTIGGVEMEQYLDGSSMLMSVDAFPSSGAFPPGTRYLKFDMDELLKASGLDTSMRELQQMDPSKVAALLKDTELETAGSGEVRGVAVKRYRATIGLDDIAKQLGGDSDVADALKDGEMIVTLALDDEDLVRAFDMTGDIAGQKMSMKAEVTSYSRDIRVKVPTGPGIYDMSGALEGAPSGTKS